MPVSAKKACNYPGCKAIVKDRYCDNHKRQHERDRCERAGTSSQRGYNYKWRLARKAYLMRNALCVYCLSEGNTTAATEVDHIIPHKGDLALFWDQSNWQSLCKSCHSRKTVTDDNGFGNNIKYR